MPKFSHPHWSSRMPSSFNSSTNFFVASIDFKMASGSVVFPLVTHRTEFSEIVEFIFNFFLGGVFWMSNLVGGVVSSDTSELSFFESVNLSAGLFLHNDLNGLNSPWIYVARIEAFLKWIVSGLFVVVLTRKLVRQCYL